MFCTLLQRNQLTSYSEELKAFLEEEQCKRDSLTKETSSLKESLIQYKATLEDIQRQRSTLNAKLATAAQDKADITRDKVSLEVQVGTLEETNEALRKQLRSVGNERDKLDLRVKEAEKRMFLAELNRSVAAREGDSLTDSSTSLTSLSELLPPAMEGRQETCERLIEEYRPLCDTLAQMRKREMDLHEELERCHKNYDSQLKSIQEKHAKSITSVRKQHEEIRGTWTNETETLRRNLREQQQLLQSQLRDVQLEVAMKNKAELASEHAKWQRDLNAVHNELRMERNKILEAKQKLKDTTTKHTKQLTSYQLQLQEVQREKERLEESNSLLLETRQGLSDTVTRLKDTNRALEQSLASSFADFEKCQQKLKESEEELSRFQLETEKTMRQNSGKLTDMQTQLTALQEWNEELQREKKQKESTLLTAQTEQTLLQSQLLAVKTELSSVTAQLEKAQLSQSEVERSYCRLLSCVEQVVEHKQLNPLHSIQDSTPKSLRPPEAVCEALFKLKNERNTLRETLVQNTDSLEQLRGNLEHAVKEKSEMENRLQELQSSLMSFQTQFVTVSQQHDTTEALNEDLNSKLKVYQNENKELQLLNGRLQRQLDSLKSVEEGLEQTCGHLWERLKEAEHVNESHKEETLQLTNMVSILKSSQINKDRMLAELEGRFQHNQQEMLEREMNLKSAERNRIVMEQRLAEFEQGSLKHESTKRELQSQVKYLESQLKDIREKSILLRRDSECMQRDNQQLCGDVEQLTESLKTTMREKQTLSESQEREIERLRSEVARQLHEISNLKLHLVHSHSSSHSLMCVDPPLAEKSTS